MKRRGAMKRPAFVVRHEAHCEIMIGDYPKGGGTHGEFAIRWIPLGSHESPRLEAFGDGWRVLAEMIDRYSLVERLAELEGDPEPEDVIAVLVSLGLEDDTKSAIDDRRNRPCLSGCRPTPAGDSM